ncbi:MAG TPA: HEAT repeat domain-containing protein [Planctomycetota bacterium]|nr:HEAT repeat domain-containing protein [Planctomycetota bacterium]
MKDPSAGDAGGEVPWLHEMVDDDLLVLFSEDPSEVEGGVRALMEASSQAESIGESIEERLVDLLETSYEHQNDATSATRMAAVILGEIGSTRAIPVLLRWLVAEDDEMVQDAALVAILRIGAPAVDALIDAVEEAESPGLNRQAYGLLGMVGALEDASLRQRVMNFLEARFEVERRKPRDESALEELCSASAALGDRRQLPTMRRVLAEDYRGLNAMIQDACDALEENAEGVPFVPSPLPWHERYGWLFEDDRGAAFLRRSRTGRISISFGGAWDGDEEGDSAGEVREDGRDAGAQFGAASGGDEENEGVQDFDEGAGEENEDSIARDNACLLWGLNATLGPRQEDDGLDARQFLEPPLEENGEEDDSSQGPA